MSGGFLWRSARKGRCGHASALGSLIVSGTVGVVVSSALVIAQVPKAQLGGVTTTVTVEVVRRDAGKEAQKVEAQPPTATPKPAVRRVDGKMLARPANLENQVQQYMRQARPIVRAELIFVRNICELDLEHFRRISHDAEAAFKEVAKTFVETQRRGRVRVPGVLTSPAIDGLALLHEGLTSVMKKDLTSEQFTHYQHEVEKRDANRKQSAVRFLVDAIDRDLYLSGQQRLKLTESLLAHWDQNWSMSLEYLLYGNQFYPLGIDAYVTPYLDAAQRNIWQGTQKVGGIGGIGGVLGNFMNDNDALEVELGEAIKPEPGNDAQIRRLEKRVAPMPNVQVKKAVN